MNLIEISKFYLEGKSEPIVNQNLSNVERSSRYTENDQSNAATDDSSNPLLSMLTNLGMQVGEMNSTRPSDPKPLFHQNSSTKRDLDSTMKNLLPFGASAISAEDLENQFRNTGSINDKREICLMPLQTPDIPRMNNSANAIERTTELVHPPPGFLPPMSGNQLPHNVTNLSGSSVPHLMNLANPVNPHNNLSAQSQVISTPGNINALRFPAAEGATRHFLPTNNSNSGTFVHSSPFGLGLSIGGLEHVIGKQHPPDSHQKHQSDLLNSSRMSCPYPSWSNLPNHQTPRANIGMNSACDNPSTQATFSLPLEQLFAIASNESKANNSNVYAPTTDAAPWPPRRE